MSDNVQWYKDAIIYQVHVRAFHDSNGDGIGDFAGLTQKLDYLEDLGISAIWLQPFYPSPLRDDGYDIADYKEIHPDYGTLRDFKTFLKEAHRRDLRVITELIINHTSDRHAWFQRARRAKKGSRWRDFYVWSDTPEKYQEARVIFKDFEQSNWAWDSVAQAYYWHRFYSHQPDLNFDSPEVRNAVFHVMDFWLAMGVDGLRLDAVPYLYEREGTNCENLPETHAFLRQLRRRIDEKYPDRMLLAEANQWPEDAVSYFGEGNECHMAFHFPVMPRLFMGVHMEDRFPIIDILQQTPSIPDNCQWAIFLRNHDELTLEMVTDEDRDYMYRVYARDRRARVNLGIRRRLAPLMGRSSRRIELMNSLLLSLPGTPVVYYGDEIGMGDNFYLGDRNGVRTPMQWSADRNAGFSKANPQQLYLPVIIDPEYHYEAVNVETQQNNSSSMLWWMKRILALRKEHPVFGRGEIEFVASENRKVLAFVRRDDNERVLVVANLSRHAQCVGLDLRSYEGTVPVELFGGNRFPSIGADNCHVTLGPHTFYWFGLEPIDVREGSAAIAIPRTPTLSVSGTWDMVLRGKEEKDLERILPHFLSTRRWFGGKARRVISTQIAETIPVPLQEGNAYLALILVTFSDGSPEFYNLPVGFATGDRAAAISDTYQDDVIARLRAETPHGEMTGVLYDAIREPIFCKNLIDVVARRRRLKGVTDGDARGFTTRGCRNRLLEVNASASPHVLKGEQSNTSVVFDDKLIVKLFRRLEEGVNPELEVSRFLTERTQFEHMPQLLGALEYVRPHNEPVTLCTVHGYVSHEGDAWNYTIDTLSRYLDDALAQVHVQNPVPFPPGNIFDQLGGEIPDVVEKQIGPYLESANTIGIRTAELHLALASRVDDPAFAPEQFTALYQRSLYQWILSRTEEAFQLLEKRIRQLPKDLRPEARTILGFRNDAKRKLREILDRKIRATRIRGHGDFHLGQLLFTGKDFVVLDFEGEPARPLGERRLKRSPLRDVAGMVRSFHYASINALYGGRIRTDDIPALEAWVESWYCWVVFAYLKSYVETAGEAAFLPKTADERQVLLDAYLLDKALYELVYELNNRPEWVQVPLRGITRLLGPHAADV